MGTGDAGTENTMLSMHDSPLDQARLAYASPFPATSHPPVELVGRETVHGNRDRYVRTLALTLSQIP